MKEHIHYHIETSIVPENTLRIAEFAGSALQKDHPIRILYAYNTVEPDHPGFLERFRTVPRGEIHEYFGDGTLRSSRKI